MATLHVYSRVGFLTQEYIDTVACTVLSICFALVNKKFKLFFKKMRLRMLESLNLMPFFIL